MKIAQAFSKYGAMQGDPPVAIRGGMANRSRKDYNDVGWGILPGNYFRFLEQVRPDETSIGWWHVGPEKHHFSRFARGFDNKDGKAAMSFRLHSGFFKDRDKPQKVGIRVAYLDKGKGAWCLEYWGDSSAKNAIEVRCADSGKWLEKTAVLDGAYFNGRLENEADLVLRYVDGDDTVFHMVELSRRPK